MQATSIADSLLGCAMAAGLAVALGLLLRACGLRHAWITAGVCVGALLGASGLGRALPAVHDRVVAGAASERREVFVAQRAIEVAQMSAMARGAQLDPDDTAGLESALRAAALRAEQAKRDFDMPALWLVALLATFVMVGGSPLVGRVAWWQHGGLAIGLLHVALPSLLVVLTLSVANGPEVASAWWLHAVALVCVGCAALQPREQWIAARMLGAGAASLETARGMAGMVAIALAAVAWWCGGRDSFAWMLPWGAMLAAWGLALAPPARLMHLAGPATAACVAVAMTRLDVSGDWRGWVTLGTFIAAEDMRWLGAGTGLALWHRAAWARSLRAAMPLADGSMAQAVLGSVAALEGVVPAWMGLSLLVSAAAVELLEPVRRSTALRLDQSVHEQDRA